MKPKVLKTEKDYDRALRYIEGLMKIPKSSSRNEELDLWATLVEAYEKTHYPIDDPDPIEAIKFRMRPNGVKTRRFSQTFGGEEPGFRGVEPKASPFRFHDAESLQRPSRSG